MPGERQTRSFPIPAVVPVPFPASPEPAGQGPVGLGGCGPPQRRVLGAGCPPRLAPLPPAQPCVIRHEKLAAALFLLKGWGHHHSLLFPCKQPPFTLSFNFRLSALFPLLPKPCTPYQCPPRRSRALGSCPWPHRRGTELYGCRWDPGWARKRLLNPRQGLCFCSTSVCFAGNNGTAQPAVQSGISASARRKQTAVHLHLV